MKYQTKAIAAIAVAALAQQVQAVPCNALVMSGGSNNGAWEVGVLWGLAHYGNPEDFYWDVVSGISAGSINTSGLAGWKPEEVVEMTEYMSNAWLDITTDDIWVVRPGVQHILNEPSIFDDSGALETIRSIMSVKTEFGRRVSVSCVDVNTGDFTEWNQKNTNYYDFGQAGLSSGSIPVVFPPQIFQGAVCMDGGTVWNVNVDSAINQCRDMGATDEEITLDILICGGPGMIPPKEETSTSIQNFLAARSISSYYKNNDGIDSEIRLSPGVKIRYFFKEHGSGTTGCVMSQLNFNGEDTWCLQEAGRRDAQQALTLGQEKINKAVNEWFADAALQKKYTYIYDYVKTVNNL